MTKDELTEIVMNLIVEAGQAKSHAMNSMKFSRDYDFENAENEIKNAEKSFIKAHEIQNGLINKDLNGENIVVDLLTVHSQDHLTTALMCKEIALELMHVYKKIKKESTNEN